MLSSARLWSAKRLKLRYKNLIFFAKTEAVSELPWFSYMMGTQCVAVMKHGAAMYEIMM